jgi:hypothetical protein
MFISLPIIFTHFANSIGTVTIDSRSENFD